MGWNVLLFSINEYDFPYVVFPLGLAHVESALRRAGHTTRLIDYNVNRRPLPETVAEFPPDFIGISLRNIDDALVQKKQTLFDGLAELCSGLRPLTRAPIILGGSGFSIFPEALMRLSGADYGIQGEGERQFVALMDALHHGGNLQGISGLVHRQGDRVVVNPRDDVVPPSEILAPTSGEPMTRFYLEKSSMLNVQTQRGCALQCCYCTYPLLEGRQYRRRPAEAVVDELAEVEKRGARYVFVVDSVFNTSPDHVMEICEGMIRRGIQLQWCCFLRPKHLTAELMNTMARAGLKHVEFGSDSFSNPVLEAYGKHLTFDDILTSSELAHRANIDYAHYLICAGPGETLATLQEGFENSRRLPMATIMARVGMRVYPGTPLYERFRAERGSEPLPDLLQPYYYIEKGLTETQVFARLREFSREMPNWIFDDPPPAYHRMAERLRARGVVGPLWSYFSLVQRLGGSLSGGSTPRPTPAT